MMSLHKQTLTKIVLTKIVLYMLLLLSHVFLSYLQNFYLFKPKTLCPLLKRNLSPESNCLFEVYIFWGNSHTSNKKIVSFYSLICPFFSMIFSPYGIESKSRGNVFPI